MKFGSVRIGRIAAVAVLVAGIGCTGGAVEPGTESPGTVTDDGSGGGDATGGAAKGAAKGAADETGEWVVPKPRALGDVRAAKGGTMQTTIPSWPENIRSYGTGSNTYLNSVIDGLCFESLLRIDPNTLEFVPQLASSWRISTDQMTFRFRLDPRAKWGDGTPVTSADVVATYRLIADETTTDPMFRAAIVDKMHEPEPVGDREFVVRCKTKDWRNFITLSGMVVLPDHEVGDLKGEEYLEKYNFRLPTGSGPYALSEKDVLNNESITLTRRTDHWGAGDEYNRGLNNIDRIRFLVVRDDRQAFDMAVKGDIDFYVVYTSKWWVEDLKGLESVEKGWLVPQKIYTQHPAGIQGLALNMRKAPLDDARVRRALALLFDRSTMVEKFAYGEYELLKSYFPGGPHENPENVLSKYDPREAVRLLEESGWKEVGADGIRTKGGARLRIQLTYSTEGLGKYFTTYKEDAKKAGVEIDLNLMDHSTQWKNQQERKFEMVSAAYGATLFPSPRSEWHSKMADQEGSNNLTGFRSAEVDGLVDEYDGEFDAGKRSVLMRRIDGLVSAADPYVLGWNAPYDRILYWRKFGTPETVLPRYGDWRSVFSTWWVDPRLQEETAAARKSGASVSPVPPRTLRPWSGPADAGVGAR